MHFFPTYFLHIAVYVHFPNTLAKVFKKTLKAKEKNALVFKVHYFLAESLAITFREQAVENSHVLKVDFICKANVFGVRCSRTLSAPPPPPLRY